MYATGDEAQLWREAERLLPRRGIETYTQALMDLGATVCTRKSPRCGECPVKRDCLAHQHGTTDRFPAPRARRALPVRKVTWWVLVKDGRVLMEKRPSSGLWGGLLTFPETFDPSWKIASRRALPPIEHGFTHFRLIATPVVCRVKNVPLRNVDEWLRPEEAAQGPVPTPVRKLLNSVPGT